MIFEHDLKMQRDLRPIKVKIPACVQSLFTNVVWVLLRRLNIEILKTCVWETRWLGNVVGLSFVYVCSCRFISFHSCRWASARCSCSLDLAWHRPSHLCVHLTLQSYLVRAPLSILCVWIKYPYFFTFTPLTQNIHVVERHGHLFCRSGWITIVKGL